MANERSLNEKLERAERRCSGRAVAIALLLASAGHLGTLYSRREFCVWCPTRRPAGWHAPVCRVALLWVGLAALRWFERTEQRNVPRLQRASLILQLCALPALAPDIG